MDRAPLRPVPGRPRGPVPDADAVRRAASALADASERDATALGLVALAGRTRAEVGARLGIDDQELALSLSRARKKLRRTVRALPSNGWCERAERLVSDRLDGALSERWAFRLDVHLRNCPRRVEHERRLVQATDALVAGVAPVTAPPELRPVPKAQPSGPAAPQAEQEAAKAGAAQPEAREVGVAVSWKLVLVLSLLLAIAAVALIVAVALGADL
jgi:hypothetical protein